MESALVTLDYVFTGRNVELHVAPDGLSLSRGGRVGPEVSNQWADFGDVADVAIAPQGARANLTIDFRDDRPPWRVAGLARDQAEWAAQMLRGGVAVAERATLPDFARPVPLGRLEQSAREILSTGDQRVVELLDLLVAQAVHHKASDIHFEALRDALRVSFRLDGMLLPILELPRRLQQRLSARLKVISDATVYRSDIPQEGRCVTEVLGRTVDLRISMIPTIHGEKATIRIFDPDASLLSLDELGMSDAQRGQLERLLAEPQGTVLLTGPSGCGKTTTLYAALRQCLSAADGRPSVATVEDPVEYDLGEANQTQVNPAVGLTFAAGLRTVLRQDPQVIMVGEVRDLETAETAIRAGLTGHLILSTVHAPSAVGVFVRLVDLGVEPYLVASSVTATISQRLLRLVCSCARDVPTDADQLRAAGLDPKAIPATVKQAQGCSGCRDTGYSGRTGIFEIIEVQEPLRELIVAKGTAAELKAKADELGVASLRAHAAEKLAAGQTTVDEVMRVLGAPK